MIQRIQSIFLALAALCTFGQFGTDAAETPAPVAGSPVFGDAELTVFDSPLLIGGVIGAGLLLGAAIFLFRNRKLQVTLGTVAIILTVAYAAYGGLLWETDVASDQSSFDLGVTLPPLAVLFSILAIRYIKKDERLVRSADRLR